MSINAEITEDILGDLEGPRTERFFELFENVTVIGMLIVMRSSCFIWLSVEGDHSFPPLSTSMKTRYDSIPLSSVLIDSTDSEDIVGTGISRRISERFNVQTFVSCNIPDSLDVNLQLIEARLTNILEKYFKIGALSTDI